MILAGDVGGTKVRLGLYDFVDGRLECSRERRFAAGEYSGLEEVVKEFLGSHQVTAACFGVPGPVRDGRLRLTNLPWTLDSRKLAASLGITHLFLINDLEANGYGVAELSAEQIYTLSEGDPSQIGNRALIAAGTGLGEGLLIWTATFPTPPRAATPTTRRATRTRSTCCAISSRSTRGASASSASSAAMA